MRFPSNYCTRLAVSTKLLDPCSLQWDNEGVTYPTNPYTELTSLFNQGKLRAILASGQAVVLHRLAIMSKDGDWIVREDDLDLDHILGILESKGARYRFGAPLDVRWLRGGWSSHFEYNEQGLRIRTDFVTRPPRISVEQLASLWQAQQGVDMPFVDTAVLAEMKKTKREKDYPVIGELARLMQEPKMQLLYSRSARDLLALAEQYPESVAELSSSRALLKVVSEGLKPLEIALDAERRDLMREDDERLSRYITAADEWREKWSTIADQMEGLPLREAHQLVTEKARKVLPFEV